MENAKPFKPFLGTNAYAVAFLYHALTKGFKSNQYTISVDNTEVKNLPDRGHVCSPSINMMHANKVPNYPTNYPGVINDGLMEVSVACTEMNFKYMGEMDKRMKAGYAESYTGNMKWFRGKKAIIKAHDIPLKTMAVDGEDLGHYKDFACVEVLPGEVEFLFNAD
jgi:hypothetical protein